MRILTPPCLKWLRLGFAPVAVLLFALSLLAFHQKIKTYLKSENLAPTTLEPTACLDAIRRRRDINLARTADNWPHVYFFLNVP